MPKSRGWGKCGSTCTEERKCCLNGRYDHTYHICTNPNCLCHTEETYLDVKRKLSKKGKEHVVSQDVRS